MHGVARHAQPIDGGERRAAGDARQHFGAVRERIERRARGRRSGRARRPTMRGDVEQHLTQRDVLAAEDVALADPAALQRREMARRDIVDVDEVQAGFDEGRHPAGGRFDDDAAGRRRLHVARPDRRRRIDDHGGQSVARDHVGDEILGDDLAALVGADRFGVRQVPGLVGEAASAQIEGRDRAGVDDPLDARAQRFLHDDAGALDIGAHDLVGGGRPEPVIGGGMNEIAHALERRRDRGAIEQIADHDLVARIDVGSRAGRADQNADRMAGVAKRRRNRRSDEAARPVTRTGRVAAILPASMGTSRCGDEMDLRIVAVRGRGFIRKMQTRAVTVAGPERGKRPSRTRSNPARLGVDFAKA